MSARTRYRPDLFLFMDLETAGFDPKQEAILEAAALLVSQDMEVLFSYHRVLPLPKDPGQRERALTLRVRDDQAPTHVASGLVSACRAVSEPITNAIVDGELLCLMFPHSEHFMSLNEFKEPKIQLAGFNPSFDLGFLREHMPKLAGKLMYRTFDVSTLFTLNCLTDLFPVELMEKRSKHRAMDDCLAALDIARLVVRGV